MCIDNSSSGDTETWWSQMWTRLYWRRCKAASLYIQTLLQLLCRKVMVWGLAREGYWVSNKHLCALSGIELAKFILYHMMHFILMNRYQTMFIGAKKCFLITETNEGHEDFMETTLQSTLKCQDESWLLNSYLGGRLMPITVVWEIQGNVRLL